MCGGKEFSDASVFDKIVNPMTTARFGGSTAWLASRPEVASIKEDKRLARGADHVERHLHHSQRTLRRHQDVAARDTQTSKNRKLSARA